MIEIMDSILALLEDGQDCVLATIVSDSGSTPRTAGSKMVVREDGTIAGTIGGGTVEGDVIASALNLFSTSSSALKDYDLSQSAHAEGMDLVCGGRIQVLLEYIQAGDANRALFRRMQQKMRDAQPVVWIGRISAEGKKVSVSRTLPDAAGPHGETHLPAALAPAACKGRSGTFFLQDEEDSYLVELLHPPETLILVGGGHVSLEIAHLAKISGFKVTVIDDRTQFANRERFPEADRVVVCPQYADVFNEVPVNSSSYVVIVTRGHLFDKEALAQALQTDCCYIGMIGSTRKRESVYAQLMRQGFSREHLETVHCPVGLDIGAETPVEIGISVMAQLIRHRAELRKNEAN